MGSHFATNQVTMRVFTALFAQPWFPVAALCSVMNVPYITAHSFGVLASGLNSTHFFEVAALNPPRFYDVVLVTFRLVSRQTQDQL